MAGVEGTRTGGRPLASPASRAPVSQPLAKTAPLDPAFTRQIAGQLTAEIREAVALSPDEQAFLADLPPERRVQYSAVAAKLSGDDREALRTMLVSGKIAAGRDLQGGGDLLSNLSRLATEPVGPGIERKQVLAEAVRAVADPCSITQGPGDTCGAATAQIMLARRNPAEYVRIVAGLASRDGKVTLSNGQTLSRQQGWDKADIPGSTGKLVQTSFMALAAGGYDAATDTRLDSPAGTDAIKTGESQSTTSGSKGLYASEQAFLQEAVLGKAVATVHGNGEDVLAAIAEQVSAGKAVSALIQRDGVGHFVQVTAVEDGKVSFVDPADGKSHTMDLAAFQGQLKAANLEAAPGTALRGERPADRVGILGGGLRKKLKKAAKKVGGAVKKAAKKVGGAVKSVAKGAVKVARKGFEAVKKAGKFVIDMHKKAFEKLKDVWDKYGSYILMAAQIVTMFVPGLQVVSLALAAYQAATAAPMLYKGIKNGDWKQAVAGVAGMAGAFAGGVGALGAKAVSAGVMTAANVAGTVSKVASGVVQVASAVENKNWGGLITGAAGLVASGAKFVGDGAAATAARLANYAKSVGGAVAGIQNKDAAAVVGSGLNLAGNIHANNLRDGGVTDEALKDDRTLAGLAKAGQYVAIADGLNKSIKSKDKAAIAGAAMGLVASGAGDLAAPEQAQDIRKTVGTLEKVLGTGTKVVNAVKKYGAGAVGGAAALAGIGYLATTPEQREKLLDTAKDIGDKVKSVADAKKAADRQAKDAADGLFDYEKAAERQKAIERGVGTVRSALNLDAPGDKPPALKA